MILDRSQMYSKVQNVDVDNVIEGSRAAVNGTIPPFPIKAIKVNPSTHGETWQILEK